MWSNHLLKLLYDIILVPPFRYPDKWKPAFLAMQLGFVAGGFGLIGRDLLFYLTVQNWEPLVLSELFFASFIFLGFKSEITRPIPYVKLSKQIQPEGSFK